MRFSIVNWHHHWMGSSFFGSFSNLDAKFSIIPILPPRSIESSINTEVFLPAAFHTETISFIRRMSRSEA